MREYVSERERERERERETDRQTDRQTDSVSIYSKLYLNEWKWHFSSKSNSNVGEVVSGKNETYGGVTIWNQMNSSGRDIPVLLNKYIGFSKFYYLVVKYFWGNGTHG